MGNVTNGLVAVQNRTCLHILHLKEGCIPFSERAHARSCCARYELSIASSCCSDNWSPAFEHNQSEVQQKSRPTNSNVS